MARKSTRQAVRRGRAFWMDKVAEFERAPRAHADFAKQHKLRLTSFRSWLYRLRAEGTSFDGAPQEHVYDEPAEAARFVELVTEQPSSLTMAACMLEAGSLRVHFRAAPSACYLAELLKAAG